MTTQQCNVDAAGETLMRGADRAQWWIVMAGVLGAGVSAEAAPKKCDWPQWGQSAAHDGQTCASGQELTRELAHVVIDPFARQELNENGSLVTHYQVPLIDGNDVFVLQKAGQYVNCDPPGSGQPFPCGDNARNTQIWTEKAMRWHHDQLVDRWQFASDWKPMPNRFEAMFQPALDGKWIHVPGAGGSVYRIRKHDGTVDKQIKPFGPTIDPNTYVSGGITVDEDGSIYYNAIQLNPDNPFAGDVVGAWLVKVTRHGAIVKADYKTLIPDAPAAIDGCFRRFLDQVPRPARPWPPPPQPDGSPTLPPKAPCLSQRPGLNVTPAIGADGTVFTVSRAHGAPAHGFVVALRPDLTLKWAASLRDHLFDGCGVLVPFSTRASIFVCREGASFGVDQFTNLPGAAEVEDMGSSSPTVLPDGGVLYGGLTIYNDAGGGHLMKFDRNGQFVASFPWGWDTTPGVYRHDGTYSIVLKQNHYLDGVFLIDQLDANLNLEWQFQNTSSQVCERLPDGTIQCFDAGVNGFEWCVNAPAIDRDGTVYVNNEDGYLYAIAQGGIEKARHFLSRAVFASYTPMSLDARGRIYAMNNGELFVIGR